MSATFRGLVFFLANLSAGPSRASRASVVEFALRVPLVGMLASVTQLFRLTEPAWAAAIVTTVCLPLIAHAAELAAHSIAATPQLWISLLVSVAMSAWATAFNLFAMRRGILIVGEGGRPFADDMKALPRLVAAFVKTALQAAGAETGCGCRERINPSTNRAAGPMRNSA